MFIYKRLALLVFTGVLMSLGGCATLNYPSPMLETETFEKLILNHRVRPTALLPVWNVAGYFLGAATAMMGEKAAMACTVAVEKVIGEHYHKQLSLLKGNHKKLKATIKKFAQDELEHHDIGIAHDAEKTPGYTILTKFIEMGCKTAIAISKKI